MRKYLPYFLIFVFVTVLLLIGFLNSDPVRFNPVTIPGKFSLPVPEYLDKTDSIDPSAVLQYKNEKEQLFLLVYELRNQADTSLKALFKNNSDAFISKVDHGTLAKYYPEEIDGCKAMIGEIKGNVHETKVSYTMVIINANGAFYKIIAGVSGAKNPTYHDDIYKIILGFRKP